MSVGTQEDLTALGTSVGASLEWLWRCSVEQYHEMVHTGILDENDRVELLDGWLVQKMTENPAHTSATEGTYDSLVRVVPSGWYVRAAHPVTLPGSEPEPDLAVARGDRRRYAQRHPEPHDLALVVEVADTTLRCDRTLKKRLYAEAEIPVYWIVNLVDRRLEVYSDPAISSGSPDYQRRQEYSADEVVAVLIEGRQVGHVAVGDLLP
jgi:Uma2 family endonuclease